MPFTSLAAVTFAVMGKFCIPMSTSGPLGFGMLDMILISSKNYVLRALSGYSVIACYKDDSKKQRYSCARIQRIEDFISPGVLASIPGIFKVRITTELAVDISPWTCLRRISTPCEDPPLLYIFYESLNLAAKSHICVIDRAGHKYPRITALMP
jgi:hypothetical protein